MDSIRAKNNNNTSSQHSVRSEVNFPTTISSFASQIRLSKLTLPTFGGNILELPTFWDSFESSIHLNSALPDIQKFPYLKSLIQDRGYSSIPEDNKPATDWRSQEQKCRFCGDKHLANECKKIAAVSAHKEVVKQKSLCFNCLGNHFVSSCRASSRCHTRHKKHHSNICDRQLNPQGQSTLNATAANFFPTSLIHTDESDTVGRTIPI